MKEAWRPLWWDWTNKDFSDVYFKQDLPSFDCRILEWMYECLVKRNQENEDNEDNRKQ